MRANPTALTPDDVVDLVASATDSDENNIRQGQEAERRLAEWADSQPAPPPDLGPAPNC